jgi:hypothetical protein
VPHTNLRRRPYAALRQFPILQCFERRFKIRQWLGTGSRIFERLKYCGFMTIQS